MLDGSINDNLDNTFINYPKDAGLKRYESMLGLPSTGTIEERRSAILALFNQALPYTIRRLRQLLDASCGEGNYEVSVDKFTMRIVLYPEAELSKQSVRDLVKKIVPANIYFVLALLIELYATETIRFVPVCVRISFRINTWMMEPILLDGSHNLDGTWTLDQQLRNHFMLRIVKIKHRFQEKVSSSIVVSLPVYKEVETITSRSVYIVRFAISEDTELPAGKTICKASLTEKVGSSGKARRIINWNLDGEYDLDGTMDLNAGIREEAF